MVLAVLDLDPVRRTAAAIRPIGVLRDQTLEAHVAGRAKQIRTDRAALEWIDKHPVRPEAARGGAAFRGQSIGGPL
jgi:hypothetical protein